MGPANFELLMNLVSPKIVKKDTRFRAAIPGQDRRVNIAILGHRPTRTPICNIFSKFLNKQYHIVLKVCEVTVEALMKKTEVKIVSCTEQTVLHLKSMGWNNETKYITNKVLLII